MLAPKRLLGAFFARSPGCTSTACIHARKQGQHRPGDCYGKGLDFRWFKLHRIKCSSSAVVLEIHMAMLRNHTSWTVPPNLYHASLSAQKPAFGFSAINSAFSVTQVLHEDEYGSNG